MIRRLPVIPTLIVLAAVAVMVRLGFWQLERLDQKDAMLARYSTARTMNADALFPITGDGKDVWYRHATLDCARVIEANSISGQSARGEPGIGHVALCELPGGGTARVILGWSRELTVPDWRGGRVQGIIAPGPRLVADPPLAGLEANARPDPADLPNNHLSYAVQWFLFAFTALVIYAVAVRKRLRGE